MTAVALIDIGRNGLPQDFLLSQVQTMDKAANHLRPVIETFATAALEGQTLVELSELLKRAALRVMGAILQDTLQQVADSQASEASCPRYQNLLKAKRKRPRKFDTLHGPVEISRQYFQCPIAMLVSRCLMSSCVSAARVNKRTYRKAHWR